MLNSKLFLMLLMTPAMAMASGPDLAPYFNFDGILTDASGTPITAAGTIVKFRVIDPGGTCMLYEEQQTVTPGADGSISVQVGSEYPNAKRTGNDPGHAWSKIFSNYAPFGAVAGTCNSGWAPAPYASRALQVLVNNTQLSPNYALAAVPMATVAETLNGKPATDFLQYNISGGRALTQTNLESLFDATNYPKLTNLLAGGAMSSTPTAPVSFNNQSITNVAAPVAATDAVNKGYADSAVGGKALDFAAVGPGIGDGKVMTWDAATNKWVAANPNFTLGAMTADLDMNAYNINNGGDIKFSPNKTLRLTMFNSTSEAAYVSSLVFGDKGAMWYDATTNKVRVYNGSSAVDVGGGGGSGITDLYGDVMATGPGNVMANINNNAITTPKLFPNPGINRLVATDGGGGATLTPFQCGFGQTMEWGASGWGCTNITWTAAGADAVKTTGNVGIGTPTPQARLHVNGTVIVGNGFEGTCTPQYYGAIRYNGAELETCNSSGMWKLLSSPPSGSLGEIQFSGPGGTFQSMGAFKWDNANMRLGIGTTSPIATFDAMATMPSNPIARFRGNSGGMTAPYVLVEDYSGQSKFMIDQNGKVGIGTTSPMASLHVENFNASLQVNAVGGSQFAQITNVVGGGGGFNIMSFGPSSSGTTLTFNNNQGVTKAINQGPFVMGTGVPEPVVFAINNQERMRIDPSGNVGIGTSNPMSPLEIFNGTSFPAINVSRANASYAAATAYSPIGGLNPSNPQFVTGLLPSSSNFQIQSYDGSTTKTYLSINNSAGVMDLGSPTTQVSFAGPANFQVPPSMMSSSSGFQTGAPCNTTSVCVNMPSTPVIKLTFSATGMKIQCMDASIPDQIVIVEIMNTDSNPQSAPLYNNSGACTGNWKRLVWNSSATVPPIPGVGSNPSNVGVYQMRYDAPGGYWRVISAM